ncbi:uncharacterized protein LOC111258772 [Varroa jacobsoni]|uniref:uncharacterized protein LOC111258772 n=1 Tax=Varroa jacobsoni TaxID=62625 RepID=UPI000BF2FD3F|nr:uncharacterized protein LOC111258772 [Varroa jacobsoni]
MGDMAHSKDPGVGCGATMAVNDIPSEDIILSTADGEVRASCRMLAKISPYFAAMLSGGAGQWREAKDRNVHLPHCTSGQLQLILDCVQSRDYSAIDGEMETIFPILHSLEINFLVEYCVGQLVENVRVDNVLELFHAADHFNTTRLRQACLSFLLNNLKDLMEDDIFKNELEIRLFKDLLAADELQVCSEDQVLEIIDVWCSAEGRGHQRRYLLEFVRFPQLSNKCFERCRNEPSFQNVVNLQTVSRCTNWCELSSSLLRGRFYNQCHVHIVWCKYSHVETFRGHELFLRCSLDETQNSVRRLHQSDDLCSQELIRSLMNNKLSLISDRLYYDCDSEILKKEETKLRWTDLQSVDGKISSGLELKFFPSRCFLITAPVFDEESSYVAHITGETTSLPEEQFLPLLRGYLDKDDRCYHRFLNGFSSIALCRFNGAAEYIDEVSVEDEMSGYNLFHGYTHPKRNKLYVNGRRKLVMLGTENSVVSLGEDPQKGRIFRLRKDKLAKNECELDNNGFHDMAVVGDLCYVYLAVDTVMIDRVRPQSDKKRYYGERSRRELRVLDLCKGVFLDEVIHLEGILPIDHAKAFRLELHEDRGRLFIVGSTCGPSRFSHAAQAFIWRLDRRPGGHELIPVLRDFNVGKTPLEPLAVGEDAHEWRGILVGVDVHPCKHATALQVHASREKETVAREKLRRFSWNL